MGIRLVVAGGFLESLKATSLRCEARKPEVKGGLLVSPISLWQKLRYRASLKEHLTELSTLIGRAVQVDELVAIEKTALLQKAAQDIRPRQVFQAWSIPFLERGSERFKAYLHKLSDANNSPLYVWAFHAKECGALLVPSLASINFDFDFSINPAGILTFSTSDLRDRLVLDFSVSPTGEQVLDVEAWGGGRRLNINSAKDQRALFNVRLPEGTRSGSVPGTKSHYSW